MRDLHKAGSTRAWIFSCAFVVPAPSNLAHANGLQMEVQHQENGKTQHLQVCPDAGGFSARPCDRTRLTPLDLQSARGRLEDIRKSTLQLLDGVPCAAPGVVA